VTLPNWWTTLVKLDGIDRRAARQNPRWAPVLKTATDRLRRAIADNTLGRADFLEKLDAEQRWAEADLDLARGAWRDEQLMTIRLGICTPEELAELDALARSIGETMAAAQGVNA
jgi:hypothetical protein